MKNKDEHNNDDNFFEDEPLDKSKIWLAIIIVAILMGIAVWFWFAKGDSLWSSKEGEVKSKDNSFLNAYETMKDKLLQEVESLEKEKDTISSLQQAMKPSNTIESDVKQQELSSTSKYGNISNEWKAATSDAGDKNTPIVKDDNIVRLDFIDNLAEWLVKAYHPSKIKGKPGTITLSLQDVNLRYGGQLIGFTWSGNNYQKGRTEILKYVFTPAMLEALYHLYVDRFIHIIDKELSTPRHNKVLSLQQKQEFYRLYAKEFRGISGVLQGIAAMPEFIKKMNQVHIASQKVIDASNNYTNTIEHIDAKSTKNSQAQLTLRVELAAQAYQKAIIHREKMLTSVVHLIKQNAAARILDNTSILYVAYWVERRVKKDPEKMDTVLQAATIFLDLAKRFEVSSGIILDNNS